MAANYDLVVVHGPPSPVNSNLCICFMLLKIPDSFYDILGILVSETIALFDQLCSFWGRSCFFDRPITSVFPN